ncbi:amine sulfotransferase-like isoform X1 [Clupea harengus]|uniref:Sulfotransferase n=1 Tax=Clupea harengus TaxID=7950 RepID=A0A8M1KRD4_CLUHA|nr:amine sulfotransferase-like isoform X1 [Clupea harengus]
MNCCHEVTNEDGQGKSWSESAGEGTAGQAPDVRLILHRGFYLIPGVNSPVVVDQIQNWEIRDSDIFLITYPKSGTIWMQQIIILIEAKGNAMATAGKPNCERMPWIEVKGSEETFLQAPLSSPRLSVTHLPYRLLPVGLRQKKAKIIYVARNPKDALVSYYHFHHFAAVLETPKDFNDFFEKFMDGRVYGNTWFEHIKAYYSHKDEMNILYVTYEDMIQDLRSVVEKVCSFLDRELTDSQMASVVEHARFNNMVRNPSANYRQVSATLLNQQRGSFMRKGTVGDWKNLFSVAQSERFDKVFQEEMTDVPLSFKWDLKEVSPSG